MKTFNKVSAVVLAVSFVLVALGLTGPIAALAATTPSLGLAATYGVLSSTYTNTTASTTINGDVGFTTGPAVAPTGTRVNYGSGVPYATAGSDQGSALSALASQACTFTFGGGAINLSTDTTHGTAGVYTPGVYCGSGAMDVGGPLTLNGSGTYIFRSGGALTTTAGAIVTLNGASACDVFWTPAAATTLAANTTFAGTVISDAGITVGANTTWSGRALSFNGTTTTDTDAITVPTCAVTPPPPAMPAPATLHVIKQVVNNNGGTATASLFNLHVKLSGTDVNGSPATGTAAPGTSYSLAAGTYVVSENANASYTQSFSGDCDSSGNVTLAAGADKTCTITNDDIAPAVVSPATISVVKTVINNNGGTKAVVDFPLFVNGILVTSGAVNTFPVGIYTVTETDDSNYTRTFSGDCDLSGRLNLIAGNNKTCTVTNDDIAVASTPTPTPTPTPTLTPTPTTTPVPTPAPLLPNTGVGPDDNNSAPWNIIIPAGIFAVLLSFYLARKKWAI